MKLFCTLWSALLLALWSAPASAEKRPVVRIAQGKLVGDWQDGIRSFRAIPYAAPPVGDKRWRPPGPAAGWQGVRDARAFGPACMQTPYPAESVYFERPLPMSEDCLTLNIWMPRQAAKAPVLVWIHGGALLRGSSASPLYDGVGFAKRGVVFVSINYRLGILGWLAHPALSAEARQRISGNYGLLDQIAALEWVRDNIAAFGGDPARVTVMGESAGALSITYLLTSPRARGLFARAILQSANIRPVPALREPVFGLQPAEATGLEIGRRLGAHSLADLRAIDARALVASALKLGFVSQGTVDGVVLPAQVVESFDRGQQARVPILAGFNGGEVRSQRALVPAIPATTADYEREIRRRYLDLAPAFLRLYPASDMTESLVAATRDAVYGWASERMVRQQTAAGQPAYLYLFDHCYPAARNRGLCAFHASELPFTFGRTGERAKLPPNWPVPGDAADRALAARMIDYWTAFARTGRPSSRIGPDWPAYGTDQAYMRFARAASVQRDLLPGMLELQEQIVARRRSRGEPWFTNIGPAAPIP